MHGIVKQDMAGIQKGHWNSSQEKAFKKKVKIAGSDRIARKIL